MQWVTNMTSGRSECRFRLVEVEGRLFQVLVTVNLCENYFVPETVLSVYIYSLKATILPISHARRLRFPE